MLLLDRSRQYGVAISDESHVNYIFMYEMLSGIRTAVSVRNASFSLPFLLKGFLVSGQNVTCPYRD